jgi:GNAT superfamily N-acetyltransferase
VDPTSLRRRLSENCRRFRRLQAQGAPACFQHLELPGVEAFSMGPRAASAWRHQAFFDGLTALADALPRLVDFFAAAGAPAWRVTVEEGSEEVERWLMGAGFRPEVTTWSMGVALAELRPDEPHPELERTESYDGLVRLNEEAFDSQDDAMREVMRGLPKGSLFGLQVREQGRLVCGGYTFDAGDTAGVYGVACHQQARGKGHATRVMEGLLWHAARRGCTASVLQSTPEAVGVYRRVGFEALGRELHWVLRRA